MIRYNSLNVSPQYRLHNPVHVFMDLIMFRIHLTDRANAHSRLLAGVHSTSKFGSNELDVVHEDFERTPKNIS